MTAWRDALRDRRAPWLFLTLNCALLVVWMTLDGHLPATVTEGPDAVDYLNMDLGSARAVLTSHRTVGYPLLLRAVGGTVGLERLPIVQLGLFQAGVLCFSAGLGRFLRSRWRGALAGAAILNSQLFVLAYFHRVQTEVFAAALALATLGLFLWVMASPRAVPAWVALGATLCACYHTRPAYLFLVGLLPLACWLLDRTARRGEGPRAAALTMALVCAGPLLLWSGVRWATVGHFGLVSFSGINLSAISGLILRDELVDRLEPRPRALAVEALAARRASGRTYRPIWGRSAQDVATDCDHVSWGEAMPAALRLSNGDWIEAEARLVELSKQVLWLEPGRYVEWVEWATLTSARSLGALFARQALPRALLIALGVALLAQARLARTAPRPSGPRRLSPEDAAAAVLLLFLAAKVALVCVMGVPINRYVWAAGLPVPAALTALLFGRLRAIRRLHARSGPACGHGRPSAR